MPKNIQIDCTILLLDLKNFRTTPQKSELNAVKAMIAIKDKQFFALLTNILEDGYLHTENIIVLDSKKGLIVKEGNRRIAILKILHGKIKIADLAIPANIVAKIKAVTAKWRKDNTKVSCLVFPESEADKADKIVALTHAKGEAAGRDRWTSVATARHNRDVNNKSEPALDLLEKYLLNGQNLTAQQKERWSGDYNLTVLADLINKIAPRTEAASTINLVAKYPKIKLRNALEEMMRDIGLELLTFPIIRNTITDFALPYGFSPVVPPAGTASTTTLGSSLTTPGTTPSSPGTGTSPTTTSPTTNNPTVTPSVAPPAPKAVAINDPKHVAQLLKKFAPRGKNREKVVLLRNELQKLKVKDNPVAFCFILRSMFEISAKAYCTDHTIVMVKSDGNDKSLVEILRLVTNHLTTNNRNTAMVKVLTGAMAEISNPNRLLSVTSMNQLVHNPKFSVIPNDICILFGNIFPLLEFMN